MVTRSGDTGIIGKPLPVYFFITTPPAAPDRLDDPKIAASVGTTGAASAVSVAYLRTEVRREEDAAAERQEARMAFAAVRETADMMLALLRGCNTAKEEIKSLWMDPIGLSEAVSWLDHGGVGTNLRRIFKNSVF
jgi:hypothetical protein